MIHLSHSVSGGQIGSELAGDEEELAYALAAIAEHGPDVSEMLDYLSGSQQKEVIDLCNSIAIAFGDD